jgi:hypothetical protein
MDAIRPAGNSDEMRAAVVKQLFETKGLQSVLGASDIDENSDTRSPTTARIESGAASCASTARSRLEPPPP